MEALKNAQCEDIIAKLPNGVDTVIGSQGTYVSGGEAQRLSIARAMLKNAPILILDEAFYIHCLSRNRKTRALW